MKKTLKEPKGKKEIEEELYLYIDTDNFTGNLEDVIAFVKDIPERLSRTNDRVKNNPGLFIRFKLAYRDNFDNGIDWCVFGYRLETDEEHKERLKKNKENKKNMAWLLEQGELAERENYERLKAKFDPK